MSDDCTREGEFHMHSDRCYEAGRRDALAEIRNENLRVIKHEAETPMRGHDENGECCRRARLGVDR